MKRNLAATIWQLFARSGSTEARSWHKRLGAIRISMAAKQHSCCIEVRKVCFSPVPLVMALVACDFWAPRACAHHDNAGFAFLCFESSQQRGCAHQNEQTPLLSPRSDCRSAIHNKVCSRRPFSRWFSTRRSWLSWRHGRGFRSYSSVRSCYK